MSPKGAFWQMAILIHVTLSDQGKAVSFNVHTLLSIEVSPVCHVAFLIMCFPRVIISHRQNLT